VTVHCACTACAICAPLVLSVLHNSHFFPALPSQMFPLPPHVKQTNNTTEKDMEYANVFALTPDPALTQDEIEQNHMQVCMMKKSVYLFFLLFSQKFFSLLLLLPQEEICCLLVLLFFHCTHLIATASTSSIYTTRVTGTRKYRNFSGEAVLPHL